LGYVEKHLIPNETVIYITTLSWIVYLKSVLVLLIGAALLVWGAQSGGALDIDQDNPLYAVGGLVLLVGLTLFFTAFIRRRSCEFAVTNKRVIIKIGLISRRSVELLLTKVEAISVDQTLLGRIFGYGSITIIGTGGTKEPFHLITDPLEFRRQTQIGATS
jgi:uncharacterized membrane protein YdbT with pleckstrin-like domain